MSSLASVGVLSVAALCYTLIVLIAETPFYYKEYIDKPEIQMRAFIFDANILTSFSLIFFAYTCQMSLMPVYSELVNPNYRRIKKIVTRSLLVDCVFYTLIASAGYFSTFNATSDVVIQRPALPNYNPDYTCLLAAVAICLVLFAAFPVNYNPARN